ncbi:MAG: EAL domain-containing protein, partial [Thermoanaerobaculia bacterium]
FAGFLLYFSTYISFGMMLVFLWGLRTERRAEQRQSQILTLSGVPVLGAVALSGILLPMWGIRSPPEVAHLIAALWVLSIWIAVSRYRLMILNPETVALDIFKTMADAAILVDRDDQVVNLNKSAEALFGASEEELRGTPVEDVFETEDSAEAETVRRLIGSADRRALELGLRRQSGELVTLRVTVSQVKDRFAQPMGSVLIMRDISDQKRAEADLKYLTTHDPLTDLPNRSLLHDRLQRALQRAIREKRPFALLTFDLDDFQQINDAYGPQRGDLVLQEVARRLSRCVRGLDTVCRLGGDEFIVLVEDLLESGDSDLVAQRILDSFEKPIDAGGQWITVTGSIGISTYPFDGLDTETLVKKADLALGSSKRRGRSGYQYYAPRMDAMNRQRVAIEQGLQEAIGENELYLVFQPLVDFATGTIAGIEALCRWQSKKLGSMSPASFIPVAERSGLIVPIGEWVLETACRAALRWQEEGLPAVPIGVNVSARQLLEPNFLGVVDRVLEETGLRPDLLELELTETTAMEDVNRSLALLTQLQDKGIQIVIDDFGTGYSSLMRLKQLPMNTVK